MISTICHGEQIKTKQENEGGGPMDARVNIGPPNTIIETGRRKSQDQNLAFKSRRFENKPPTDARVNVGDSMKGRGMRGENEKKKVVVVES